MQDITRFILGATAPQSVKRVVASPALGLGAYRFGVAPRVGASQKTRALLRALPAPTQKPISAATFVGNIKTPPLPSARLDVVGVAARPLQQILPKSPTEWAKGLARADALSGKAASVKLGTVVDTPVVEADEPHVRPLRQISVAVGRATTKTDLTRCERREPAFV